MIIPPYPASRPISMADKPLIDHVCSAIQPRMSELTFAGLYLFRNAHSYELSTIEDSLIVRGKGYNGTAYFLPPLGGDRAQALEVLLVDGKTLYGSDDLFPAGYLGNNTVQVTEMRDSFDYLYLREDLSELPGRHFHKKKNRINYFTRRHEYTVALFSSEHLAGCLKLLEKWAQGARNENEESVIMEVRATSEALHAAEELGFEGVVVIVNETVAAFSLGERLNRDTVVCHFEKADPFAEGLYQLINREFARLLFPECRFINREQDLGDMGLRNAKLSYHPVELVQKFFVHSLTHKDSIAL